MRHTKLIVFGIVLVGVVAFGAIFWGDLVSNQQELSNTPLPPSQEAELNQSNTAPRDADAELRQADDYDSIEADLNSSDVDRIDQESGDLEAEINAL